MSRKKQLPKWLALTLVLLLGVLLLITVLKPSDQSRLSGDALKPRVEKPVMPKIVVPDVTPDVVEEPVRPTLQRVESGLALIVDDVGYDLSALQRILKLSVPVAIAVIPDAPYAEASATLAHESGQMVMLHLPMEPASEKYRKKMTSYFLHEKMDREQLRETFLKGLAQVPYVEGVNNHMGSYLTELAEPMRWVMQVCREKELFFVDSKTSHKSVAADMAQAMDLPWASRQIFLDHDLAPEAMQAAWQKAEACLAKGYRCLVIGHPHRETVAFLEAQLSAERLDSLIPVAQLLRGGDAAVQAKLSTEERF
ncbi:divergent polysaccharide deacetylase family protein [Mariprofundus sp. KV]|uniref:divergent polysaccharide deacetylase family protein n=1 Tax=Mariprofundus sp. KV TaxID=2608715 RepID=UPI0015A3727D|nr:divergent polysaccharide deacetylase family protein [Mariprofundus sp. KV]NWF36889.1 divergent polysaccharide deacetylase family protein [Mariprofundus sp. KV]